MKTTLVFLFIALTAGSARAATLPEWMAGSWRLDAEGTHVEEHWTTGTGGIMLGMSKTVPAKGRTSFEFLRITERDGALAYLAMPSAQPETTFTLLSGGPSRVVFENAKHDFPQRILYWRVAEKLCARIEGTLNGAPQGEEWCYERFTPPAN